MLVVLFVDVFDISPHFSRILPCSGFVSSWILQCSGCVSSWILLYSGYVISWILFVGFFVDLDVTAGCQVSSWIVGVSMRVF